MTIRKDRTAAAKAVKDIDPTLPDPPDEAIERGEPAIKLKVRDQAAMRLREKKGMSNRHVPPTELPTMPGINALSFTVRYLPGGRKTFLEFVKLAAQNGDQVAYAWWCVFADLPPGQRLQVNFDDVCAAAGVKPSALIAGVVGHGMEAMTDMGNLVAAVFHPKVMEAMGKSAVNLESEIGAKDRQAFLQARGFLPTPKGASIHVHANASANSQAASASSAEPSVPKFASDLASLGDVRQQVQRQLIAESTEDEAIDAEAVNE